MNRLLCLALAVCTLASIAATGEPVQDSVSNPHSVHLPNNEEELEDLTKREKQTYSDFCLLAREHIRERLNRAHKPRKAARALNLLSTRFVELRMKGEYMQEYVLGLVGQVGPKEVDLHGSGKSWSEDQLRGLHEELANKGFEGEFEFLCREAPLLMGEFSEEVETINSEAMKRRPRWMPDVNQLNCATLSRLRSVHKVCEWVKKPEIYSWSNLGKTPEA